MQNFVTCNKKLSCRIFFYYFDVNVVPLNLVNRTPLTLVIVFLTWYWDTDKSVMSNLEGQHARVWCHSPRSKS
jgi:hypothetical protein